MVRILLAIALVVGCQGQGREAPPIGSDGRSREGSSGLGQHDAPPIVRDATPDDAEEEGSARVKPEEPEQPDSGKAIAELGAVPAWQAVVDRTMYVARRGQHGVVYGVIGPPILVAGPPPEPLADGGMPRADAGMVPSPYVWLVDDTEGNGALAIRVALGTKKASAGDRVALGGAWALDDQRQWYWKVDAMSPLPPGPPSDLKDPAAVPGHAIATGGFPAGVHKISAAKDGDAVYFQLVGPPPAIDGDGWPVADELGNPVVALLNLPGERASYGAQDMRAADERWQLKRGQTYWVRIGHVYKHADKPATMNARTAPIKVM